MPGMKWVFYLCLSVCATSLWGCGEEQKNPLVEEHFGTKRFEDIGCPFFCRSQGVVHQMCGGFVGAGQPIRANFAGPIPRRKQAVSSGRSTALAIRSGATCAVIDLAVLLV